MSGMGTAPEGANNVKEAWILYDTVRISKFLETEPNGEQKGYTSFAALAGVRTIPFFNVRNSSIAGIQYTNVQSIDKLPWPFILESIGARFIYPSPYNAQFVVSSQAAAKVFQEIVPEHCALRFTIREDDRLLIKAPMAPAGFGPVGSIQYGSPANPTYCDNVGQGEKHMSNRFKWTEYLNIPRETPIKATLEFSPYAQALLTFLAAPQVLDFQEGPDGEGTLENEALIELSLRGYRLVQQRGEYWY